MTHQIFVPEDGNKQQLLTWLVWNVIVPGPFCTSELEGIDRELKGIISNGSAFTAQN